MTQLALSTDLQVITAEINSYKQVAGQAVFEIGKRLKHVKENDLTHGQFGEWLQSVDIHERQAQRLIKVAEEFGGNATTWSYLPFRALYEIATMPEEERDKPQVVPSSGEIKIPNEMTTRELQEVKKSLKEAEQRARQAEMDRQAAIAQKFTLVKQIEELKSNTNRSPEDEQRLRDLREENQRLFQANRKMEDELFERNSAMEKRSHDLRKMKESLSKTSAYVLVDLSTALMHFRSIHDQKEAIEVAERFWAELDGTISKKRMEWQELMKNDISESEGFRNEYEAIGTVLGRQAVIIDADTST